MWEQDGKKSPVFTSWLRLQSDFSIYINVLMFCMYEYRYSISEEYIYIYIKVYINLQFI